MINKTTLWRAMMAAAVIPAMTLAACDETTDELVEDVSGNDNENADGDADGDADDNGVFVFATTVTTSGKDNYVLVTSNSLDEGTVSTVGNGLALDQGATQWEFYKNTLYGLTYNQGNDGGTRSYYLNANGDMKERNFRYNVSRFTSYGFFGDDIITMSTGDGPAAQADANGYIPQTLIVTYLNVPSETKRENDTSTGAYSVENFLGNGEYVTLSGAEESAGKLYCGAIPMGLSQYGVAYENGKWILPGNEDLVTSSAGGTGGGSYKANTISGTQYPNECWVAIYDDETMTNPTLVKTDKISYPAGRFASQYYQTIWAADNGDIYVFSPSYAKTQTDSRQRTELPAGVCRIKAGQTEFDDYYCDIEAQTPGGNLSFMRCWPAGGNYFLMVMYDVPMAQLTAKATATTLAIFDADAKKLTYVTGVPAELSSIGKTTFVKNGKVYIALNVTGDEPAIYGIDPATAVATKGVTIKATSINGFGYLTPTK